MTAAKRIRQGVWTLTAFSRPIDYDLARQWLTPPLFAVFQTMSHLDQLHSLNVLRHVLEQEADTPPDLAAAALLHDAGKSRYPLALWQKTLAVIGRAAFPERAAVWSEHNPAHPLYRPFAVYAHHPAWSADMIREAGASDTLLWLVRHHQQPPPPDAPYLSLLQRLQRADDAN